CIKKPRPGLGRAADLQGEITRPHTICRSEGGRCCSSGFHTLSCSGDRAGRRAAQSGGPNYGPTDNRCVNTHTSEQVYNSSLPSRTNAEVNGQKFSDQDVTGTTSKKHTNSKIEKPRGITQVDGLSGTNES